jgi:hypothetical protein
MANWISRVVLRSVVLDAVVIGPESWYRRFDPHSIENKKTNHRHLILAFALGLPVRQEQQ